MKRKEEKSREKKRIGKKRTEKREGEREGGSACWEKIRGRSGVVVVVVV